MKAVRTRYELRVRSLISKAALATFRIPVSSTAVPRNTVYRFRVPTDRDLSEVLHRLTERDVEVLEIRRCLEPRRRDRRAAQPRDEPPRQEGLQPGGTDRAAVASRVVVPFRRSAG